ncbi:MAG: hypothetical protein ABJX32_19615 [Tateyamaria sp.]|uniref:hypothetical protein n=1 Tax=Tateyamaria sp. TaxID=1929288 RepID=UPI00329CA1B9
MIRTLVLALVVSISASPSLATFVVSCEAPDGSDAAVAFGFGSTPGLAIFSATIHADGTDWSMTEAEGAMPIVLAQGASEGRYTLLDFADPDHNRVIASVRLISAAEGDGQITVGTLKIPDVGVFPLICEGP